ncbi:hillarin-like, partial [Mizuhopecten yessoensis]|uniref:hillarin-like n=1 Tax=Mizuhopecten yessoensis TaxID=6573 RepID=UPI000B45F8C8
MGNETSSKSQNAAAEPKKTTTEDETKTPTGRGRKTTPQNDGDDKGEVRNNSRPGIVPKPLTALSNRSEEEYVRYHGNTPMGRLQRSDLYPFFKYQYRPRRGRDYRFSVKTASTVSDVDVSPNHIPADPPVGEVDESELDDTKLTEADIYDRARSAPATLNDSYKHLTDYLFKGIEFMNQPDLLKTRVVMIWLSRQDLTSPLSGPADYETPEKGIVRLSNNTQFEYSRFLSILYEKAGIKSVEISGVFKPISYEPDNGKDLPETSWIAVYLDGRWQLIMPYFVCTRRKHTWLSSEPTNKETMKDDGEGPVFNYFYFLMNPKQSINWFYPNEPKWQLLKRALQKEEYLELPLFKSEFFELGLTLVSKNSYNLHSEEGRVIIDILSQEDLADEIYLWYDIALVTCTGKHNVDTQKMIIHDNLQRLVAMVKHKEKWMFQMTLPIEGVYKVTIYASVNGDDFGPIVKFRLHCENRFDKCSMLPADPKEVGFGPGLAAKDGGLLFPSHSNGFYSVGHSTVFTVSFVLAKDIVEAIEVTSTLAQTEEKGVKG